MNDPARRLGIPRAWSGDAGDPSLGWRVPFGDIWSELATVTAERMGSGSRSPLGSAKRLLDVATGALRSGSDATLPRDEGRLQLLRAAAAAAEASVLAWGPFAGSRPRVRWLRQLERDLERVEMDMRCAEQDDGLDACHAEAAARRSLGAMTRVAFCVSDTANDALRELECATIDFAIEAIRGADNLERRGVARPRLSRAGDRQLGEMARIAARVAAGAEEQRFHAQPSHPAVWLQEAIVVAEQLGHCAAQHALARDAVLRADAAAAMHSAWARLAAAEMLIAIETDALLSAPILQDWAELRAEAAGRACQALVCAGMLERPGEFDHVCAAAHHSAALVGNVGRLGVALQHGDQRRLERVSEAIVDRVARALAALWSLDAAPLGAPREEDADR